jgi:hypothetical protein
MIRLYFTSGLTLISIFCVGQERFVIKGHLKYCYDKSIGPDNFRNFQVSIVDTEPHYKSGEEILVNESGEFSFENLRASNYKISTHLFKVSSIIVTVDKDIDDIILCVDNDFRPVPQDTLAIFVEKAKNDIIENSLKIYYLSPGLVIQRRHFYRRNRRLKRKFNFQIETVSCLLVVDRQSFVEQEKYLAYNKVAEEYLDTKYGSSWRSVVK